MRKVLITIAVANVVVCLTIVFGLSYAKGMSWMWVTDFAHQMEASGSVNYQELGTGLLGKAGPADRHDLEYAMGIQNVRYYSYAATALLLWTVMMTGMVVFCALRIRGDRPPSPRQTAAPGSDVPNG